MAGKETHFSVGDLTSYIQSVLERDSQLRHIRVQGELSNFKMAASGHWYFSMKDARAQLPCVMFRSDVARMRDLQLQQGDQIEVEGRLTVYAPGGRYQLQAYSIRQAGLGALFQEFLKRKEQLAQEGWFDEQLKRPLPAYPRRIGLITSAQGAALYDALRTLKSRFAHLEIIFTPSLVQGAWAGSELAHAVASLQSRSDLDLLLLIRGGGSFEDLFCFNEPELVRAIGTSRIPVVTGIGHETDFSLADFAADYRAATPTAAAAAIVPEAAALRQHLQSCRHAMQQSWTRLWREQQQGLDEQEAHLRRSIQNRLQEAWKDVDHLHALMKVHPLRKQIHQVQEHIDSAMAQHLKLRRASCDQMDHQLRKSLYRHLERQKQNWYTWLHKQIAYERMRLHRFEDQLQMMDVSHILRRGFTLLTREDGSMVRRVGDVEQGDQVRAQLADGRIMAEITSKQNASTQDNRSHE